MNKDKPSKKELFLSSPCAKAHWLDKESFVLLGDLIFHTRLEDSEKNLVIPDSLNTKTIRINHHLPSSGHQGVARTKAKVREKFFWHGLGKDVANFVATCAQCNKNKKASQNGHSPMQEYQAGAPMERVYLDFLGPLPITQGVMSTS